MPARIAINGFGRIGRNILRSFLADRRESLDFVAINDLTDASTLAHLLKYDSFFGVLDADIEVRGDSIIIGDRDIRITAERDPANLPWSDLGVDVVMECTGLFRERDKAERHLDAGAGKVIISAPATGEDITICMGVNHTSYQPDRHNIISNASCTTNCLAPVAKILLENFGISKGLMSTVHAYTNDQKILDLPHKDLRRARSAALSIIPTTTGAAKAVSLVLPELKGKLDGIAIRVPVPDVSMVDLTVELERDTTEHEINLALRDASEGILEGILGYCEEPCVSVDFKGMGYSSIVDALSTQVQGGRLAKVLSWYDNEWGFSCRMVDLAEYIVSGGV